jgi:hypothetical protein
MHTFNVLFLASNPSDQQPVKLDEEIRSITRKIEASKHRDVIHMIPKSAVRTDDLLHELNKEMPSVVHFSGHGNEMGELMFMNDASESKPVNPAALKAVFTTLKDNIKLVVLNACYSEVQAKAIVEVIDCVIGMDKEIGDEAAIVFSSSFYRAIGFGRSVKEAFDQGIASLMLEGIPEHNIPKLIVRQDVDPSTVYLLQDIINSNYEVSKSIYDLRSKFSDADYNRKQAISLYFQKIASTLKDVVASLRANFVPHGNCQKMLDYAEQMPSAIGDYVGTGKAIELSEKLKAAYDVEQLFNDLPSFENREERFAVLEKAAGNFEATADTLLVMK